LGRSSLIGKYSPLPPSSPEKRSSIEAVKKTDFESVLNKKDKENEIEENDELNSKIKLNGENVVDDQKVYTQNEYSPIRTISNMENSDTDLHGLSNDHKSFSPAPLITQDSMINRKKSNVNIDTNKYIAKTETFKEENDEDDDNDNEVSIKRDQRHPAPLLTQDSMMNRKKSNVHVDTKKFVVTTENFKENEDEDDSDDSDSDDDNHDKDKDNDRIVNTERRSSLVTQDSMIGIGIKKGKINTNKYIVDPECFQEDDDEDNEGVL
jgi:hypothetical protein